MKKDFETKFAYTPIFLLLNVQLNNFVVGTGNNSPRVTERKIAKSVAAGRNEKRF